jgi:hypothetical protein
VDADEEREHRILVAAPGLRLISSSRFCGRSRSERYHIAQLVQGRRPDFFERCSTIAMPV